MVDFVDIVDIVDFVDFLSPELTFIFLYSKYIILGIIGRERFYSITRNFDNNNIRNKLKVAKFFGNYKFLYMFIYKYINIYE